MAFISRHITPLVINSLGGGHTHANTHTHTHTHIDVCTETVVRNYASTWFEKVVVIPFL